MLRSAFSLNCLIKETGMCLRLCSRKHFLSSHFKALILEISLWSCYGRYCCYSLLQPQHSEKWASQNVIAHCSPQTQIQYTNHCSFILYLLLYKKEVTLAYHTGPLHTKVKERLKIGMDSMTPFHHAPLQKENKFHQQRKIFLHQKKNILHQRKLFALEGRFGRREL